MAVTDKLGWGLQTPDGVTGARWGARAIYSENRRPHDEVYTKRGTKRKRGHQLAFNIELLWDRQCMVGGTDDERKALGKWVNDFGLKQLAKKCDASYITTDCEETVVVSDEVFELHASPRASYGYLYICAFKR